MSLDRRRLEEGFLLCASLVTLEKYNLWEQVPAIPFDRNEMVELVTLHLSRDGEVSIVDK